MLQMVCSSQIWWKAFHFNHESLHQLWNPYHQQTSPSFTVADELLSIMVAYAYGSSTVNQPSLSHHLTTMYPSFHRSWPLGFGWVLWDLLGNCPSFLRDVRPSQWLKPCHDSLLMRPNMKHSLHNGGWFDRNCVAIWNYSLFLGNDRLASRTIQNYTIYYWSSQRSHQRDGWMLGEGPRSGTGRPITTHHLFVHAWELPHIHGQPMLGRNSSDYSASGIESFQGKQPETAMVKPMVFKLTT